jgi:hypothetical protein
MQLIPAVGHPLTQAVTMLTMLLLLLLVFTMLPLFLYAEPPASQQQASS